MTAETVWQRISALLGNPKEHRQLEADQLARTEATNLTIQRLREAAVPDRPALNPAKRAMQCQIDQPT